MFAQKAGLHDLFYAWNVELFHENPIYTFDEKNDIGKIFKNLTLYPTLFVEQENLVYVMYQGRPTGLLYSNNVLSIFIVIYTALTFSYQDKKGFSLSDLILPFVVVLSSSTLVIITYLFFLLIHKRKLKNLFVFVFSIFLHSLLFPGLTSIYFDMQKHILSLSLRFYEIFDLFGFNSLTESIANINLNSKIISTDHDDNYSLYGLIFKSNYRWMILVLLCSFLFYIIKDFRSFNSKYALRHNLKFKYGILFIAVLFSQLATIYLQAPAMQFVLGIALYPVLYKFHIKKAKLIK